MNAPSDLARRLLLGASLCLALAACQGPDAFYRENMDTPGQAGATGTAGTSATGAAGTNGAAGTLGVAGTSATGAAGTSAAAGTNGAAGTSATGAGGTSAAAGTNGRGGTTGSAGTSASGGTTGGGGRGGRGGGGGGRGGSTGTAGSTGAGGTSAAAGSTGAAGTSGVCAQCMPQVMQKCQQDTSTNSIPVQFRVVNNGAAQIPWSDITVRYWFSHTTTATPVMEIDDSQVIPKANITGKFTADYVEIGFTAAAGSLYAFDLTAGSGPIQFRFHPTDYSNWNTSQLDDYSYQMCAGNTFNLWRKTTVYIKGVLAWGTEPP